ncbi:uncharacterized protein LOC130048640 [Ostrea edulis]|uniref:uncharacterized protein LOC130048640 n=1 Tax=Ostrea edulis TaxID=37623 RepID=UPI0024AEACA8|nr:uncharacterized protein LOC130048640 [Ostrea edulis]
MQSGHPSQPRLSIFYGESATKGEADYDQWCYEVKSLLHDEIYKEEVIMQAIRRSVRGEASRILMRLEPGVRIKAVLEKFESVYGTVDTKEELLAKFYSAKQEQTEDVTSWSCRLEYILRKLVKQGLIGSYGSDEMLKSKFWSGLRQELKDISGFKYEMIADFDKLRVELRKIEREHKVPVAEKGSRKALNAQQSVTDSASTSKDSEVSELKYLVQDMSMTMKAMGKEISDLKQQTYHHQPNRNKSSGRGRSRNKQNYNSDFSKDSNQDRGHGSEQNLGPQCYRCKQYRHFKWQCTVRLDH